MVLSLIVSWHLVKVSWKVHYWNFKPVTQWSFEVTVKESKFFRKLHFSWIMVTMCYKMSLYGIILHMIMPSWWISQRMKIWSFKHAYWSYSVVYYKIFEFWENLSCIGLKFQCVQKCCIWICLMLEKVKCEFWKYWPFAKSCLFAKSLKMWNDAPW